MPTQLSTILANGATESGAFAQSRLPIFPRAIKECTTADSSPYVCSIADFEDSYGTDAHRRHLTGQLAAFVAASNKIGVRIGALLVGGSFLERSVDCPRDIDCLAYYSIDAPDDAAGTIVSRWNEFRRGFPIDVKLCPIDAGPLAIIKRSIFFSNLFSVDKQTLVLERGTVLIEFQYRD